jgi:hypothetical protein
MATTAIVRGVACPSCGGSLDIQEGTTVLECGFCKTALLVLGDRGIRRFYVPIRVTKDQLLKKIQSWFKGIDKARDLRTEAKITEIFPIYVPFWRVQAKIVGWVFGDEKRKSNKSTTYVPVERNVNQDYEFTCPACDIGEFGVKWIDLKGDDIRPFDLGTVQREAMTFGIMTTPTDVIEDCDREFMIWGERSARVDRVTFKSLHRIGSICTLVYYPLWIVRYKYKERIYQISADAETLQLLYGRAPGNNLYRVGVLLGSMMLGNLLLSAALRGAFDDGTLAAIGGSIVLMLIGFRKFRMGGEVKIEQKDKMKKDNISGMFDQIKTLMNTKQ